MLHLIRCLLADVFGLWFWAPVICHQKILPTSQNERYAFSEAASTSTPWLVPLLLFTLLKTMSLPAAYISTLLYALRSIPLQVFLHRTSYFTRRTVIQERGRTHTGQHKGDLGYPALISASEEPASMWSLLRQMPGKRSAETGFRGFYTG